jgi:hypothetical protein
MSLHHIGGFKATVLLISARTAQGSLLLLLFFRIVVAES